MGNQTAHFSQKFSSKFAFIEFQPESKFGPIKIYRKKEPAYDYVMIVQRNLNEQQIPRYKQELNFIHNSFKQPTQPMLLKLYGYQIVSPRMSPIKSCNNSCRIKIYLEYSNYTLRDLITHRNSKKVGFRLQEIIHVLYNLFQIYHFFQKLNVMHFCAKTDCIFIGVDGGLKFSPIEILSQKQTLHSDKCEIVDSCKPVPIKKKFKINQNLLIYEIKKLAVEMSHSNINTKNLLYSDETPLIFEFLKRVQNCSTIDQIWKLLYKPSVENLQISPVKPNSKHSSDQLDSFLYHKQSPVFTETSKFSGNTKMSVKKVIKQIRQDRPNSYQTGYYTR